jgi:L-lactate dehydrogenase complex protein LldF
MGAVLTPALVGIGEAGHLPNASTFCGRCESVCPVKIPLPKMMRHWREREFSWRLSPPVYRSGLKLWAWVAQRPALYHVLAGVASRLLGWAGLHRGRFRSLPLAQGWTAARDMPAPQGRSFQSLWAEHQRRAGRAR